MILICLLEFLEIQPRGVCVCVWVGVCVCVCLTVLVVLTHPTMTADSGPREIDMATIFDGFDGLGVFDGFGCGDTPPQTTPPPLRHSKRTSAPEKIGNPRKSPERWTFLSLDICNAPNCHAVATMLT